MKSAGLASPILFALVLALAACGPKAPEATTAFDGFVADTTREILGASPELIADAGLTEAQVGAPIGARLDDRLADSVDLRRAAALRRFAQTRAVDRATLSDAEQITYDVLAAQFSTAAGGAKFSYGRFSDLGSFSPYVISQVDGAYLSLPGFFARDVPVSSYADAELYLKRLGQVAGALDAETARARLDARAGVIPPGFVIDRAAGLVSGFLTTAPSDLPYLSVLRRRLEALAGALPLPPAPDTPEQARARALLRRAETIVANDILPAYRRTAIMLAELRGRASDEPGVWRLPDGDAYYKAALAAQTSSALTPDDVHKIGLARVRALSAEMDMMLRSQGLTDGTVGQRMAQLTADPRFAYAPTPEGHAAALNDVTNRINSITPRLGRWFRGAPKSKLDVREAPGYVGQSFAGGYYESPPLNGGRAGAFVLNLNARDGLTKIDLPTLVYHEAEPGHHLQVSRAIEQTDAPVLRRLIGFNSFTEGWALYAEQLADEMGLYDGDPIGRLGYLRWQMWRAARLVVDTGIHAKHWTRAQAAAYLADVTGDAPVLIETEIERYAVSPGQACGYEIGRMNIVRLRDKARAALGPSFDIRDFHEAILANGDLPPAALEAQVDAWLARAKSGGGNRTAR